MLKAFQNIVAIFKINSIDFRLLYVGLPGFVSKVGHYSRGWPEGSLFDSYYTKV